MTHDTTKETTIILYGWRDLLRLLRPVAYLLAALCVASFISGLRS